MAKHKPICENLSEDLSSHEISDMFREQIAVRHYLLGQSNKKLDADKELKKFHSSHRSNLGSYIIGSLVGAAAAVLLIFLIPNSEQQIVPETSVTVFSANHASEEVKLQKNPENSIQTLTTPRKRDYTITLPDGSTVCLNAESQLSFPVSFSDTLREVHLRGEAYFKIAPDKKRPFIVNTENVKTRVLGTEFNLRNYSPFDTHITLVTGSIEVCNRRGGESISILPGYDAFLETDGSFSIEPVETKIYTEWKNGYFYFDKKLLAEVMQDLGRWYDIDIIFSHQYKMNYQVHFVASKKGTLQEALDLLNSLNIVNASIVNGKVIIQ